MLQLLSSRGFLAPGICTFMFFSGKVCCICLFKRGDLMFLCDPLTPTAGAWKANKHFKMQMKKRKKKNQRSALCNSLRSNSFSRHSFFSASSKVPGILADLGSCRNFKPLDILAFQYLKGAHRKDGDNLFSRDSSDRTRGNGFKLKQWFRLDIRKKFFTMRMVRHWNGFPREVVEAPSLETFNARLDGALSNLV